MTDETPNSLRELLSRLSIPPHHAVLFTDGSGSKKVKPGGYAAILLLKQERRLVIRYGAASHVSSQEAELRAVQEATNFLLSQDFVYRPNGYHVVHVTDSSYVAGKLQAVQDPKDGPQTAYASSTHRGLWVAIQAVSSLGIRIHSRHVPRNQNPLMEFVDSVSKLVRVQVTQTNAEVIELRNKLQSQFEKFPIA